MEWHSSSVSPTAGSMLGDQCPTFKQFERDHVCRDARNPREGIRNWFPGAPALGPVFGLVESDGIERLWRESLYTSSDAVHVFCC
jgi:hypothetical protein